MAHINIKPLSKHQVYDTAEDAISHVIIHRIFSRLWDFGGAPFGQTMDTRRTIDAAIKDKDCGAFVAYRRRGYWRVELA